MKKIIVISILFSALMVNSQNTSKDYITFSGKILNRSGDSLLIVSKEEGIRKFIPLNSDGAFSDTLRIKESSKTYSLVIKPGYVIANLYLKNGFDLQLEGDFTKDQTKAFGTYTFSGVGEAENNCLAKVRAIRIGGERKERPKSNEESLERVIEKVEACIAVLNEYKDKIDPLFYENQFSIFEKEPENARIRLKMGKDGAAYVDPLKGKPSPTFTFENYKGGATSLADFKGKYVYIDIWATWCAPCLAQLPFLQKIEEEYHNKNIVFVSISTDAKRFYDKWKTMVAEKNMGGVQLYANGEEDPFFKEYNLAGIPRFILIDPAGNVVNSDAPRPSDPKLKELLNSLPL